MKKVSSIFVLIFILMVCSNSVYAKNENVLKKNDLGDVLTTDIVTYINGQPIQSYNINGNIAIITSDLIKYGFDVDWNEKNQTVTIRRNLEKAITNIQNIEIKNNNIGEKICDILYTDITTYLGDRKILSFNLNGQTAIYTQDLELYGTVLWDNKTRQVNIELNNFINNNSLDIQYNDRMAKSLYNGKSYNSFISTHFKVNWAYVFYDTNTNTVIVESQLKSVYNDKYNESSSENLIRDENDVENYIDTKGNNFVFLGRTLQSSNLEYGPGALDAINGGNKLALNDIEYYSSQRVIDYSLKINKLKQNMKYEKTKYELEQNDNRPIKFIESSVTYNCIDTPQAYVEFENISSKDIDAFEVNIYCYDNYDRNVNHYLYKTNKFNGISQSTSNEEILKAGMTDYAEWVLYGFDNTSKIKVVLSSVHYTDGHTWKK